MRLVVCSPLVLCLFLSGACTGKSRSINSMTQKSVAVTTAPTWAPQERGQRACRPSFTAVSEKAIVAKPDPTVEFGARAALIGCESDLATINSTERARIVQFIRNLLIKEHYILHRKSFDSDFRRSTTREINALLGRPGITDVLIFDIYSREFDIQ